MKNFIKVSHRKSSELFTGRKALNILYLLGITLMSCFLFSVDAFAACNPGPKQVAFFQHTNYKGKCAIRGAGNYQNSSNIGLSNDSISSIKMGFLAKVRVCINSNFGGICNTITKNTDNLKKVRVGRFGFNGPNWNDRISSAIVSFKPIVTTTVLPGPGQVAFYEHSNYRGKSIVLGQGYYNNSNEMKIANDSISSIKLGKGAKVRICKNNNQGGRCTTISNDLKRLSEKYCFVRIQFSCMFSYDEFNDAISSVRVLR